MQSSASAIDLPSNSALPVEMAYGLPPSLPAATNYEIRVQPVNSQSFQAGNVIQFDIPSGKAGQYLDPSSTYIRFKITYTQSAGVNGTDYSYLLGSSYSPFIKQECYGNNSVLLESINEVGVLSNMLLNSQLNMADKMGLSPSYGFGWTSTALAASSAGHRIFYDNGLENLVFDYCCPLIGILGSGTDKFIPMWSLYQLRFELTCDSVANFTRATTANALSGYTISDVEFVGQVVVLGPEAQSIVHAANPNFIHIRSQTWRQASNLFNASAGVGIYDLLCGIRVSSLKSLYACISPSNANEKKYSGVCPNLTQGTCWTIGGQNYPQRGLNPADRAGDCFIELQKSFGALGLAQFNGGISKSGYYIGSTAYSLLQAYNTNVATIASNPNQWFMGVDLEVVQRKNSLLSGINVNAAPLYLHAVIGSALSNNTHTVNMFGFYDLILEFDTVNKTVIAKF